MASIDAFWDLAASGPVPKPLPRVSLLRVRMAKASSGRRISRDQAWTLAGVVLLHVVFALLLREAMHPVVPAHSAQPAMLITFIFKPRVIVPPAPVLRSQVSVPPVARTQISGPPIAHRSALPLPQRAVPRADALQAVTIAAPASLPSKAPPLVQPQAWLYDPDGKLRVPPAPTTQAPRDLMAHRSMSHFLPGGALPDSPNFHVTDDTSPEDVVNTAGRFLSGLVGGVKRRPDGDGTVVMAADRGLRTTGRDSDPCEDIAQDLADVDPDHQSVREEAGKRWDQSCQGH